MYTELWNCFCLSVAALFTLSTLIVYSVVPELKNPHGSLLCQYLISYLGYCAMWLLIYAAFPELLFETRLAGHVCGSLMIYFGIASPLWLNAMSFDIWRTFRNLPFNRDGSSRISEKYKSFRYSIYAWGTPLVFVVINQFSDFFATHFGIYEKGLFYYSRYVGTSLFIIVAVSNGCFYILTALAIRKRNRETARVFDAVHKHQKDNEQWFNLYMKLFIVMGVRTVFWIVLPFVQSTEYRLFFLTLEVLDSVSVFMIFVWKDGVKRSFHKQCVITVLKMGLMFRCHSTPAIEHVDPVF